LIREWQSRIERVMVVNDWFAWNGATYTSLSAVAFAITGTKWNSQSIQASKRDGDPNRRNHSERSSALARGKADSRTLAARGSSPASAGPERTAARGSNEAGCRSASTLRDLHPRLD
jgi:hypothetical protein